MTLNTLLPGVSVSFARKPDDHIVEGKPEWANIVLNEKIGIADKIEVSRNYFISSFLLVSLIRTARSSGCQWCSLFG